MSRFRQGNPFFIFLLFVIALLVWMTIQVRSGKESGIIASPIASAQRLLTVATRGVANAWERYVQVGETARENLRLKGRLHELEAQAAIVEELRQENERLRNLLNMAPPADATVVGVAQVVSWDPAGWARVVMIDRGSLHGIAKGMAAMSGRGLMGRVVGVNETAARVLLVTDGRSAVAVRLQPSRTNAILEGTGRKEMRLLYVLRETPVAYGEIVVTSGLDGVFPAGLPVGVVVSVDEGKTGIFKEVQVRPVADLDSMEEVILYTPESEKNVR